MSGRETPWTNLVSYVLFIQARISLLHFPEPRAKSETNVKVKCLKEALLGVGVGGGVGSKATFVRLLAVRLKRLQYDWFTML